MTSNSEYSAASRSYAAVCFDLAPVCCWVCVSPSCPNLHHHLCLSPLVPLYLQLQTRLASTYAAIRAADSMLTRLHTTPPFRLARSLARSLCLLLPAQHDVVCARAHLP